jgi:two-component system sensor histidine kinase/response regulator
MVPLALEPGASSMSASPRVSESVLIVDDTIENLRLLSSMLSARGYEVRAVSNGRQALQAAEGDPPDLILLDVNMPEMNGYEVCRALKAHATLRDVPVIFLTALGEISDKVKAFDAGAVDYVTKPFQVEEVEARVRTHMALRRASRELFESHERLTALEKLRDDLVHMVVHDMRSPLTVLGGHLSLLRESAEATLTEDAAEDLRKAERCARTLSRMVSDLLDVSRLENQKLPLHPADHDLSAMVEDVCSTVGTLDKGRSIRLEIPGPVTVRCDGALVKRVLENLVGNAIKHTPAGVGLTVAVSKRSSRARVEVRDLGPGVPPDATERIFRKFETLAARAEQKYDSVGLGLAFCKLAIEAHGCKIGVLPGVPRGSVFWFELPSALDPGD